MRAENKDKDRRNPDSNVVHPPGSVFSMGKGTRALSHGIGCAERHFWAEWRFPSICRRAAKLRSHALTGRDVGGAADAGAYAAH